jgi:amino acid transporter
VNDQSRPEPEAQHELKAGALGVGSIVFMVVATAAPLSAMIASMPIAVAYGNGIGVPGTYLLVGIILALFAVGYAAMSRHMTNAGAFFAYITVGLGRRLGMAGGLVAVLSYNMLALYVTGVLGFFANSVVLSELSINIPWEVFSFGLLAVVLVAGIRGIELNARVLAVLLVLETGLLLIFDVATLITEGPGVFSLDSFSPSSISSGSPGLAFLFVFLAFIGFEATAIFGEEAKDPKRTVPRATMIAIAFIAIVYLVTSWAAIGAMGGATAPAAALEEPGSFFFSATDSVLGGWSVHVMSWLLLTSLLAVMAAIHNMSTRYLMAFGREGVFPRSFARTHSRYQTPYIAAIAQAIFVAAVVAVYAIAGADPYLDLGNQTAGVGVLGVLSVMVVTSVSVVGFYWGRGDRNLWTHAIAPLLAALGLGYACYLVIHNYPLLTESTSDIVNRLPWMLVIVAVIGFTIGWVRPQRTKLDIFRAVDGESGEPTEPSGAVAAGAGHGEP